MRYFTLAVLRGARLLTGAGVGMSAGNTLGRCCSGKVEEIAGWEASVWTCGNSVGGRTGPCLLG